MSSLKFFSTFSSRQKNCLIGRSQLKKFATIWGLLYIFEGGYPPTPGGVSVSWFDHVFYRFARRIPNLSQKDPSKMQKWTPKQVESTKKTWKSTTKHENRRENREIDTKTGGRPPQNRSSQKWETRKNRFFDQKNPLNFDDFSKMRLKPFILGGVPPVLELFFRAKPRRIGQNGCFFIDFFDFFRFFIDFFMIFRFSTRFSWILSCFWHFCQPFWGVRPLFGDYFLTGIDLSMP